MFFKNISIILIAIFAFCGNAFAQQDSTQSPIKAQSNAPVPQKTRYLQISTNPSTVDLYTGSTAPDFASRPQYTSPAFIPIPDGANSIVVSFFHKDYADTTINITLSSSDTSFIIVALRQTYDEDKLAANQELLKHRNKRNWGRRLQWLSIAPFTISGISAIVTLYDISKAKDHKKAMQNTRFKSERYDKHLQDFKDYRESAKSAKTTSKIFLGTGLLLLSAGFILSF